jgi:hypothetical protein
VGRGWAERGRIGPGAKRRKEMRKLRSRVDGKELKEKRIEDLRNEGKVETGIRQDR